MELILVYVLLFGAGVVVAFLLVRFSDLLDNFVIQGRLEDLSADVKREISRKPAFTTFREEDREAYMKVNVHAGITSFWIGIVLWMFFSVIKQFSIVVILIGIACFAAVVALFLLADKIAVGSREMYEVRAQCLTYQYKYPVVSDRAKVKVVYYDFKSMTFEGATLYGGLSAGMKVESGQYCYVIVRAKKNRLKVVNISPKPYLLKNSNEIKELYEKIYKKCREHEEEYGSACFEEGASETELRQWEDQTGIDIPDTYRDWLKQTKYCEIPGVNGILQFPGTDIPPGLPDDFVMIGTIVGDGERICFSKSDGHFITFFEGRLADSYPDFAAVLIQRFISGMDGRDGRFNVTKEEKIQMQERLKQIRNKRANG